MQTDFETRADLQAKLDRLYFRKRRAQQHITERGQHPSVLRFHLAEAVCRREGLSDWPSFAAWFVSMRSVQDRPPNLAFFLYDKEAKELGVAFDLQTDREAVRLYTEARVAFDKMEREEAEIRAQLNDLKTSPI